MPEFTIERLGHLGDGISRGPVYAPMTLPGELVTGEVEGDRLNDIKIITPSTARVRPPCSHFKSCGGCSLQHASDSFLEGWKEQVVRDALAAHGLDAPVKLVATSPAKSRRRATLSGRRTKKGAMVGLHGRASNTIVEIPNCQLLHPDLILTLPVLCEIVVMGGSRKGEVSLAATVSDVGIDVAVTGGKPLDPALQMKLAALANQRGLARISWDDELVAECRPPVQRFGSASVVPPAGSFLQATVAGQEALVSAVKRAVGSAKQVVDLFAGCGTFSLPLAETAEVHAVESEQAMLAALDTGWRHATGLKKITTETRDLYQRPLMPDELKQFDAVVIDPPRVGAEAQAGHLAQTGVPRIVFVSCNPVTFARDARIMVDAGYRIDWVEVVDQFRWSPHVELVASLSKC